MPKAATTKGRGRRVGGLSCWLLAFLFAACMPDVPASALNPERALYQYAHTAWRTQDGNFDGTPTQVMQDGDGYMWVGTSMGLARLIGDSSCHQAPQRIAAFPVWTVFFSAVTERSGLAVLEASRPYAESSCSRSLL